MNATNLKIHFRGVHEDTKDNKRNSCGKNFSLPENLKSHFKLFHECQKDHKCEICEKSFVRTRDLKGHIRAVHGEVRDDIECNVCSSDKFFTQYYEFDLYKFMHFPKYHDITYINMVSLTGLFVLSVLPVT